MGRTTKPCPGCGVVQSYRAAAEVCDSCKGKLAEHTAMVESLQKQPGYQLYLHSSTYHWESGFYGPYKLPHTGSWDTDPRQILDIAFHSCIEEASLPVAPSEQVFSGHPKVLGSPIGTFKGPGSEVRTGYYHGGPEDLVRLLPEQRLAFHRLFIAIDSALSGAYAQGRADGEALLQRMATGEVSISEYDDKHARPVETEEE